MKDIVERLRAEQMHQLTFGGDLSDPLLDAADEIERLRAALKEGEELLEIAYHAHQKMGLEGCGANGLSDEVRMFAAHFSEAETPKTPQHVILKGTGRYWKWRHSLHALISEQQQENPDA